MKKKDPILSRRFARAIRALATLLLLWTAPDAPAQSIDYQVRHLTVNEGLAHTDATCIEQDATGFIWIGTYQGLNRFDGYEIRTFINSNDPLNRVYANRIADMHIAYDGKIWLATAGGIECFDPTTEAFLQLEYAAGTQPIRDIHHIHYTSNHQLMIGNGSQFKLFNVDHHLLKEVSLSVSSAPENCYKLAEDPSGKLWVLSDRGIYRYDVDGNKTFQTLIPTDQQGMARISNSNIHFRQNHGWLAGSGGFMRFDLEAMPTSGQVLPVTYFSIADLLLPELKGAFADSPNSITAIREDNQGMIWLGTTFGMFHLDPAQVPLNGQYYHEAKPLGKYDLSSNHVNDMMIDYSDNLWISTFGGGVNFIDLNQKQFYLLQQDPQRPNNTLSGNFARAILEDRDGDLWIGTRNNGLNRYRFATDQYENFYHDAGDPTSLCNNNIRSLAEDKAGRIWIGTSVGVSIYDKERNRFSTISSDPDDPNSLSHDVIFALSEDYYGQIWAGSWHNGLTRIHYNGPDDYQCEKLFAATHGLCSNRITFIFADPNRPEILIGTDNGINHVFLQQDGSIASVITYQAKETGEGSLSSNFIWPIQRLDAATLWVGTLGGGLNKLSLLPDGTYRAKSYQLEDGCPFLDVESLLIDQDQQLWLGGKGLAKFDPETETFIHYDTNDGLQSNSFKIGAACHGRNGRLYFGGTDGISYFYPDSIRAGSPRPHIALTGLYVNNEPIRLNVRQNRWPILERSLNVQDHIRLSHLENSFSIEFAALHYANPDKCKYQYRLEGYDGDWLTTSAQNRRATYSNLGYGDYTFLVKASNGDGVWSQVTSNFKISIVAPWWATGWAKFLYCFLTAGILLLIYWLRIRSLRLEQDYTLARLEEKKAEEIHQMRLQFFTNISHELKTPLTLILNPLESLMRGDTGPRKARRYYLLMHNNAKRLLNLVNELMDFRKAETGAYRIKASQADLPTFIREVIDNFHEHALLKDIDFSFQVKGGQFTDFWFDKSVLEKILLNIIGNAFKYTEPSGRIAIELIDPEGDRSRRFAHHLSIEADYQADRYVWLRVMDSGVGIQAENLPLIFDRYMRLGEMPGDEKTGTGVGLALVKSLVLLHRGKIIVSSEKGKGTEFLIGLPCGKAHLAEHEVQDFVPYQTKEVAVSRELLADNNLEGEDAAGGVLQPHQAKILLVEDNQELRRFIREGFSGDYQVIEAADGRTGLKLAREHHPDIIVSDVMMPVMDGVEFCRQLKEDETISHIPFIILTAKSSVESRVEGVESGADIYLSKPFSMEELQLTVRNIIASREKLRGLYLNNAFSEAHEVAVSEKEKSFMTDFLNIINANIENTAFDIDQLCREIGMSRTKLYHKVKDITGKSVGEFIRSVRLNKAAEILAREDCTIIQAMYQVGIQSQSYFTKSFRREFGKTPSQFVADLSEGHKTAQP